MTSYFIIEKAEYYANKTEEKGIQSVKKNWM